MMCQDANPKIDNPMNIHFKSLAEMAETTELETSDIFFSEQSIPTKLPNLSSSQLNTNAETHTILLLLISSKLILYYALSAKAHFIFLRKLETPSQCGEEKGSIFERI